MITVGKRKKSVSGGLGSLAVSENTAIRTFYFVLSTRRLSTAILALAVLFASNLTFASYVARANGNLYPYAYLEDGKAEGIVVELANALFETQKLDVDIVLGDWSEQQALVRSGDGEMLLHINPTESRLEWLSFSDPFIESEMAIFFQNGRFNTLQSLNGKRVGVEAKGFPYSILTTKTEANIQIVESWEDGFAKLSAGELDAILVDRWVGESVLSSLRLNNINASPLGFEQSFSQIAVPKDNAQLLESINQGLAAIRRDGTYDRILSNWASEKIVYTTVAEARLATYLKIALSVLLLSFVLVGLFAWKLAKARRVIARSAENLQVELKSAHQTLSRQLERQRHMFAVIGHELRTPAATLNMLLEQQSEMGESSEYQTQLYSISEHLVSVLDDLRYVVNPDAARHTKTSSVSLYELIESTSYPLRVLLREHQLELVLAIEKLPERISINPQILRQILTNLVKNSAVHSGGTSISIGATSNIHPKDADIRITVTDDGRGIDPEFQTHLFEAFQRGKTPADGTGLGLYICRELSEQLGGELKFEPAPSGGSRFILTFSAPRVLSDEPVRVKAEESVYRILGKRVLLAEDNKTIQLVTAKILENAGARVTLADNGIDALAQYKKTPTAFDLILTDIMMPKMDGYNLTSALRAEGCKLPIIGVTAASIGEESKLLLEHGATKVLTKPFKLDTLIVALS